MPIDNDQDLAETSEDITVANAEETLADTDITVMEEIASETEEIASETEDVTVEAAESDVVVAVATDAVDEDAGEAKRERARPFPVDLLEPVAGGLGVILQEEVALVP